MSSPETAQRPIPLSAVRDLLAPGVRGSLGEYGSLYGASDAEISIDPAEDRILLEATVSSRVVTGIIPRANIADGSYKAKFRPLLIAMREWLFSGTEKATKKISMEEIT